MYLRSLISIKVSVRIRFQCVQSEVLFFTMYFRSQKVSFSVFN